MWEYNKDDSKWALKKEKLELSEFDFYKQEFESYRLYSKCLNGSSYVAVNDIDDIYDILSVPDKKSNWFIGTTASQYSNSPALYDGYPINSDSSNEYYNKFNYEYGLSLKNLFTPDRIVKDSINNFIYVDVATVDHITDLTEIAINRYIDSVRLVEGHRVLVKDQVTQITLLNSIDPNTYFVSEFKEVSVTGNYITYEYYNDDNGIYTYKNNLLVKENILDDYKTCVKFSVAVKLGTQREKQFHLMRLLNGYYPTTLNSEPLFFKEKKNWVVRNVVQYNNLFDISYNDVIKHCEYKYKKDNIEYTIPERIIAIGEFGVIINHQSGISNIIRNKYKDTLRSITQTDQYYWIAGDNGLLLKVSKHNFEIEKINLDCENHLTSNSNLKSISFFNDSNGVVVGDLNVVLITSNGGKTWDRIDVKSFNDFNYNTTIFKSINSIYVGGDNGVFIQFKRENNKWEAYKRRISKFIDSEDELLLVDNINSIISVKLDTTEWNLSYYNAQPHSITDHDLLFIITDNNNIIIHDVNNSIPYHTSFFYLEFIDNDKIVNFNDIKVIENRGGLFYFSGYHMDLNQPGIFTFDIDNFTILGIGNDPDISNRIISNIQPDIIFDKEVNSILNYKSCDINNNMDLYIAGNNSLLSFDNGISFEELDIHFESRLKSRLLYLDYDIASKVNFFDDSGEYRLPNEIIVNKPAISSLFMYNEVPGEGLSWSAYWFDSLSDYKFYNSVLEKRVTIQTSFSLLPTGYVNEIVNPSITTSLSDIRNLAPMIDDPSHSKYIQGSGPNITVPVNDFGIYLYDYLMVINLSHFPNIFTPSIGDCIKLESDTIDIELFVNNIHLNYVYLYTNFNSEIIKSLKSDSNVKLTNLNLFSNKSELIDNFNNHPIGKGYEIESYLDGIKIKALFNNYTAYYNMANTFEISYGGGASDTIIMEYDNPFVNFGFTPTYNILNYLTAINDDVNNPTFYPNKEFLSMPVYTDIKLGFDYSNGIGYSDGCYMYENKIYFGSELKFEWESIFINTFCDIPLYGDPGFYNDSRYLVYKKYETIIKDSDGTNHTFYVIELIDKLNYDDSNVNYSTPLIEQLRDINNSPNNQGKISIRSRRKLWEISADLMDLNNIQRSYNYVKKLDGYHSFEKEFNFKINTDSYAKILLSDKDISRNISGLIYNDDNGNLAMNITRLESKNDIRIISVEEYNGIIRINSYKHNLKEGYGVVLTFDDDNTPNEYFGYQIVHSIIDEYSFTVNIPYNNLIMLNIEGYVNYIARDPFLNYQPVDIIDVGIDKRGKISVELKPENTKLTSSVYSLIDVDYNKHRFRLIDGLDVEQLYLKYNWIYEADISNAVIGEDENGLVWYCGTWECGRWFGGTWVSGIWRSGDWYDGTWRANSIVNRYIEIDINERDSSKENSIWLTGRWFGGTWENGIWRSGRFYDGTWKSGDWLDGLWNDGTWENGTFKGGVWILGTWLSGKFGATNAPSYWLNGNWKSGDFENGLWYDGNFGSIDKLSRFGLKSHNSRMSIWKSGNWINGSFHSRLNLNDDNEYIVSDIHKYSIWYNGIWNSGDFYGGVVFNIDWKSGTWHGGIVEDIPVLGFYSEGNLSSEHYFIIEGVNLFPSGYEINIIDNYSGLNYSDAYDISLSPNDDNLSNLGSNDIPGEYNIIYSVEDLSNGITKLYVDRDLSSIYNNGSTVVNVLEDGLRIVSKFRNCNWISGTWFNGIYQNGTWEGGVWYNGVFEGTWT